MNTSRTLEDFIFSRLVDKGMWEKDATSVLETMKKDESQVALADRWTDFVEDYSKEFLTAISLTAESFALAWIDANLPKAWYRRNFVH